MNHHDIGFVRVDTQQTRGFKETSSGGWTTGN